MMSKMMTETHTHTHTPAAAGFRINASLSIDSFESSPDAVTRSLGLFPSRVCRKGEAERATGIDTFVGEAGPRHRQNLWVLKAKAAPSLSEANAAAGNRVLEKQVTALLDQLSGREDALKNWAQGARVSVAAYALGQMPALTLPPAQMQRLAALGISLDLDIHDLTDTDDLADEETPNA